MMPSIDPKQMASVQEVSGKITAEMRIYPQNPAIHLKFSASTPEAETFLKNFVPQFGETMATMLTQFFSITGTIVNVGGQTKVSPKAKAPKDDSFDKMRAQFKMKG